MASDPETTERKDRRGAPRGSREGTKWQGRRGNVPHEKTEATSAAVAMMIACGATLELIAYKLGCSHDTLQRHYREEIEFGLDEANAIVGGKLFQLATGRHKRELEDGTTRIEDVDHNTMQRSIQLWMDRRGGKEWRQRQAVKSAYEFPMPTEEEAREATPDKDDVEQVMVQVKFVPAKPLPPPPKPSDE